MTDLHFACLDVHPDRYAAAPTLVFRLAVEDRSGEPVHAIALRMQIRIEPARRNYDDAEAGRVADLFGDTSRWGDTLKPMQFTTVSVLVPSFTGRVELDVPVACTYDFDVAASKYLHALRDGDIPFLLLFSGTVFSRGENGFSVSQVPWHEDASYRMPARVWHELMDMYFPGTAWIRLRRDTLDALQAVKSERALPTWDDTLELLVTLAAG